MSQRGTRSIDRLSRCLGVFFVGGFPSSLLEHFSEARHPSEAGERSDQRDIVAICNALKRLDRIGMNKNAQTAYNAYSGFGPYNCDVDLHNSVRDELVRTQGDGEPPVAQEIYPYPQGHLH